MVPMTTSQPPIRALIFDLRWSTSAPRKPRACRLSVFHGDLPTRLGSWTLAPSTSSLPR